MFELELFSFLFYEVFVFHNEEEDTCDNVNEEKNNNCPTCGEISFLFSFFELVESDETENEGEDCVKSENHTKNDENFCC